MSIDTQKLPMSEILRSLGPGIIAASAAIGGSHLVSSTQAGAIYGWALAGFILLINFMKYPFFRAGPAYLLGSGEDLVAGYNRMGKGYVWLLWALEAWGGVTSVAACCVFTAALVKFAVPSISMTLSSILVMSASVAVLLLGQYKALNAISKFLVALLAFITVLAVCLLIANPVNADPSKIKDISPWTLSSLGFIVMLMGWMPCPLDLAAIQSVWVRCQSQTPGATKRGMLFDFNFGIIVTALLAVVFLALGTLVMHQAGIVPAKNGVQFTTQLIGMYGEAIGHWSRPFIAVMAFSCMWGSTITVLDGYARVLSVCQLQIKGNPNGNTQPGFLFWIWAQAIVGLVLVLFFNSEMLVALKFAMISAFCTTPLLAWLNFRLMTSEHVNEQFRYGSVLKAWCYAGLTFLFGFLIIFIWWFSQQP